MTPDRIDANPDENAEHGILDESGNLDTASITILSGHIAQVSVGLPPVSDEDDLDDDVVEDEVPLDDTDLLPLAAPERAEHTGGELVHEPHVEQLPTGDIILEPHPEGSAEDSVESDADGDVHDAEIVHDAETMHDAGYGAGRDESTPDAGADEGHGEAPSHGAESHGAEIHGAESHDVESIDGEIHDTVEPDLAVHDVEAAHSGAHDIEVVDAAALSETDAADPADPDIHAPASTVDGVDAAASDADADAVANEPGADDSHGAVAHADETARALDANASEEGDIAAAAPSASPLAADEPAVANASSDDDGTEPLTRTPWVPAETRVASTDEPVHDSADDPTHDSAQPAAAGHVDIEKPVPAAAGPDGAVPSTVPGYAADTASAPAVPLTGAVPATRAERAATGVIGTVPLTRRSAQQADEAARVGRAHALERVKTPPPEVSLTSKRLGQIDDSRESADLLTADRLLDPRQIAKPEPEGLWQQLVYSASGRRINLGDGRRARQRKDLDRRIAAPLAGGARFVPVLSRKGGVGKTTVTSLLGMALADARDDRIIAVDANPDRGTLADRVGSANGRTVRDLVRAHDAMAGYNDVSSIVARDATRLDVLASDADPRVSEAFSDDDYRQVADVAAHYYSIVLTDTGTGIVHSVMGATLELADTLVIVAGLSVDEARLASETLTWLETNGYAAQVRDAVVVLNNSRPGAPLVKESELEAHFRSRVRAVIRVPYDARIAAGSAITFRELQPGTRQAARELAAAVVEGLRTPVAAA
ncbi:nucleotide-binding protein [Microbacterium trichothecenolyticum]|uniref:MinD-like ATPase involved in chromosome partitioning or flagellar assembly n=1 Tax=Microbacterium trichothecenolyticum TaxID=69370 RepID=A0ABU0TS90_MICTR|nr:MinD/ParA family protein [Microbacterium trichothecenolyticum]MDQ1122538.1 MinD-like ATPase involved in chromosome partitioning or flagellar assembly [Microbacterium trichothecenolyticum]